MLDSNAFKKHHVLLFGLFMLGNACITAPAGGADEFGFLGFLVAAVLAIVAYFIAFLLPLNKVTLLPLWLLAFYCSADAFVTFVVFISDELLEYSPRFFIALVFAVLLVYISYKRFGVLCKFSLACGLIVPFVVMLFFLSTIKDFNIKNIYIYELPNFSSLLKQVIPYIKGIVLPALLAGALAKMQRIKKSVAFAGIGGGLACFGICILNSVLLFGTHLSGKLAYPYSSAGSTVNFGYLFTRLDGFLYFVYFSTCLVKCAVGIYVIKKSRNLLAP